MEENFYALAVSILRKCTPEQAFELLETGKKHRAKRGTYLDAVPELRKLREQGLSYEAIGELYGMSKDWVYARLKREKEKCAS
jgi:DNA invertase Pin-like site-specific DNA recombinase